MTNWTASKMGKESFKKRVEKGGKEYLDKHAKLMRNAKQAKKALKDKEV